MNVYTDRVWDHTHIGWITWKDDNYEVHKVALDTSFRLRRGETAELFANLNLTTPFHHWESNFIKMRYVLNKIVFLLFQSFLIK